LLPLRVGLSPTSSPLPRQPPLCTRTRTLELPFRSVRLAIRVSAPQRRFSSFYLLVLAPVPRCRAMSSHTPVFFLARETSPSLPSPAHVSFTPPSETLSSPLQHLPRSSFPIAIGIYFTFSSFPPKPLSTMGGNPLYPLLLLRSALQLCPSLFFLRPSQEDLQVPTPFFFSVGGR